MTAPGAATPTLRDKRAEARVLLGRRQHAVALARLLAPEGTPPPVRERIARDRELVRARIAQLLEAGLALRDGPAIDAEIASHAAIAALEYFGRMLLEEPERFDTDRVVGSLESLLQALAR